MSKRKEIGISLVLILCVISSVPIASATTTIANAESGDTSAWDYGNYMSVTSTDTFEGTYSYKFNPDADYKFDEVTFSNSNHSSIRWAWKVPNSGTNYRDTAVNIYNPDGEVIRINLRNDGSVFVNGENSEPQDTGIDTTEGEWYQYQIEPNYTTGNTFSLYVLDQSGSIIGSESGLQIDFAGDGYTSFDSLQISGGNGYTHYIDNIKLETQTPKNTFTISGTVTDSKNGTTIPNATVEINGTDQLTNENGFYTKSVGNGTYEVKVRKKGYTSNSSTITISGSEVTQNFTLTNVTPNLEVDTRRFLKHGTSSKYVIVFDNGTARENVTSNATVVSNNTSVLQVFLSNHTIVATSDEKVNDVTYLNVTYTDAQGETYNKIHEVTVANQTVKNLAILPDALTRSGAVTGDSNMFFLLIAALLTVPVSRFTSSFGGLATGLLVMIFGWFAGYVSLGITFVGLFTALFIGLNLAANIDYTVRR